MNNDQRELLQRHFDGEANADENATAVRLLAENDEAAALHAQWSAQREALAVFPPQPSEITVEKDWNTLKARLLTEEETPELEPEDPRWKISTPIWAWSAVAAVIALIGVVLLLPPGNVSTPHELAPANIVERVETGIDGATPIVYVDPQTGWSVVWVDEGAAG
ncbi:MAG: hypothetical protein ACQKBV_10305 [Puniceicoccales bacterium]